MKSLSQYVHESLNSEHSKFLTIVFKNSDETGELFDYVIGYIDNDSSLSYYVDTSDTSKSWFRISTGGKYHDSRKRNWSKKFEMNDVPAKYAEHAAELIDTMSNELLIKTLDSDDELSQFMDESLIGDAISSASSMISNIVLACTKSSKFLQKLLLILNDAVSAKQLNESKSELILERSWFAAIATNMLLYFAAKQVAKIDNGWIRALLYALIAKKVIDSNGLAPKLRNLLR